MTWPKKPVITEGNRRFIMRGFFDLFAHRRIGEVVTKALRLWRREGFLGVWRVLAEIGHFGMSYTSWVKNYDRLTPADRKIILQHIATFSRPPLISILMPVYNPPEKWLRLAIKSVRRQIYPHWELCIADDASSLPHVRAALDEAQLSDSRIKVVYRTTHGHISVASNTAMEMVTGEFIALLDQEDELSEHALYLVAAALDHNPELDMIYSDEDLVDGNGKRSNPYFKPDWNPDLFFGQNFISRLGIYRTSLARITGGFREGFEGSQDWDFALRIVERIDSLRIHHIPHVLYHWRSIPDSNAHGIGERNFSTAAGQKALEEHWRRQGVDVRFEVTEGGYCRTIFPLPDLPPLVSIIIPTRNGLNLLCRCLEGLLSGTDYPAMEVIVVDNRSDDPATLAYLAELSATGRIHVLSYDAPFNYAAINNMAVMHANGELICLLNNDIEPIAADWLREMVSHALRPGIGAVGAMLYYPGDTIQHAGVVLNGVAAGHLHVGLPRGSAGYANRARLVQNLSAVTAACLLVCKRVWGEVGGMDEINLPVAFNDVDFCLKVQQRGYRNLWTPFAELYHHESASRGRDDTPEKLARFQGEIAFMQEQWGDLLRNDPAWNPNLALDGTWPRLAIPPRGIRPWRHFGEGH